MYKGVYSRTGRRAWKTGDWVSPTGRSQALAALQRFFLVRPALGIHVCTKVPISLLSLPLPGLEGTLEVPYLDIIKPSVCHATAHFPIPTITIHTITTST